MSSDSNAPLKMSLRIGDVDVQVQDFLQSATIELVSAGAWTGSLELFDVEGDYLESLLFQVGRGAPVLFTLGWDTHSPGASRTFHGKILVPTPHYLQGGTQLTLEMVASGSYDAGVDRQVRAYPAGSVVSSVVAAIAASRGWSVADYRGKSTIEPTQGVSETALTSVGESDMCFITEQLVPQAVNAQGEGNYRAFLDSEGVLHFHTPNFLRPVVQRLVFARRPDSDIVSFTPTDASVFAAMLGGSNAVYASAASKEGDTAEVTARHASCLGGQTARVDKGAEFRPTFGDAIQARPSFTARTPEELARLARSQWDRLRKLSFPATLMRHGTHAVRVLDYVDVDVYTRRGSLHYMSGHFQVFKVKHVVQESGWETEYELQRGGVGNVPGAEPQEAVHAHAPYEGERGTGHGLEVQHG